MSRNTIAQASPADAFNTDPYVDGSETPASLRDWGMRGGRRRRGDNGAPDVRVLALVEHRERYRRMIEGCMRAERFGGAYADPVPSAVPALRILASSPLRVTPNASRLVGKALVPVEPAPDWEVLRDVSRRYPTRRGEKLLQAQGYDTACYSIVDGRREVFTPPTDNEAPTRRKTSGTDVGASFADRLARFGADVSLADGSA